MSAAAVTPGHVLVTGASRGIGAAVARALAGSGWRVTLAARTSTSLEEVRASLPKVGAGEHVAVEMDIADADSIAYAFEAARAAAGPLKALVNNAGIAETGPTARVKLSTWQRTLDVNLTGTFLCTQAVLKDLIAGGSGRIVNVASTSGQKGYAYCAAYSASKHGVLGLTRSLAIELAKTDIQVNAVCPTYVDTDIVRHGVEKIMERTGRTEQEAVQAFAHMNPQQRLVHVDEVAETVRWLLTDAPRSMTGATLSISGGEVQS
jgi:NAD(P)-dependent dehydrogenase (short-subunit alcohol dehydrogenase family)